MAWICCRCNKDCTGAVYICGRCGHSTLSCLGCFSYNNLQHVHRSNVSVNDDSKKSGRSWLAGKFHS